MHRHSFSMSDGGCFVVGEDSKPCDMTYACSCGEHFELATTIDGFSYLPRSFDTQEHSGQTRDAIEMVNDAKLGILDLGDKASHD